MLEREIGQIDAIIAMSEFSRDMHHNRGFKREMEVLPYFLPDPETTGMPEAVGVSPHDRPFFFFAGRLERIKGLQDVIPVFSRYPGADPVSYTHLRAHETPEHLVCRLLL